MLDPRSRHSATKLHPLHLWVMTACGFSKRDPVSDSLRFSDSDFLGLTPDLLDRVWTRT